MDAVTALRAGEVVILPTDTVYGLCPAPEHAPKLAAMKGRPAMPIALLCADLETLFEPVPEAPGRAEDMLPGPPPLVLANPARRFPELGGGGPTGARVP